jgi:hypothetical protein
MMGPPVNNQMPPHLAEGFGSIYKMQEEARFKLIKEHVDKETQMEVNHRTSMIICIVATFLIALLIGILIGYHLIPNTYIQIA